MAQLDDRKKILDLLESGRINADQASDLLRALGGPPREPAAPPPPPPPARTGTARLLRISIDATGDEDDRQNAKIRVNVPLGLAKFAARFLPAEAKSELDAQGVELTELINALSTETPEGRLVDIDVDEEGKGKKAKIVIEVV
ncbi:MAG: hypothetical protein P1P87_12370 [Trueperaceae bacterium]|nr:hypothetical protein [Trueperaceae bacterium]